MKQHEVVVVGAGPVGLSLALRLARAGRGVLVLEKNPARAEQSRAPAIWPGTQEVLAELGVIQAFLDEGIVVPRVALLDVDGNRTLFTAPIEQLAGKTSYPHLLVLPQSRTEQLLLEAVQREPAAHVHFSHEVTGLTQHDQTVELRVHGPEGGYSMTASVVAGCDGAHSVVREAIGAGFDGITYNIRAALADLHIENSSDLAFPRLTTRPRLAIGIRIARDVWRLILPYAATEDLPLERRAEDAAASLFGERAWKHIWQSEFRLHRRVSSKFAEGRVVLAGDAAHLNSPVGGQGMNAGIQDTVPLACAIEAILDTGDSSPLEAYARDRRREIRTGVNQFTNILTRVLLGGQGRMIRVVLNTANAAMRIGPFRRRFLRNLAMLR